jgi:hypothetical protein
MAYGTIKVDTITFTNGGADQNVTVSGLVYSTSGDLTITGTISGGKVNAFFGNFTSLTGTTVSGTNANFQTVSGISGVFTTSLSGTAITGNTAGFTTITGTTVTGATANFISGVFTTQLSGTTVTGNTGQFNAITGNTAGFTTVTGTTVTGTTANFTSGNFTNISGGTHIITSGVFALGTAAAPSISFTSDPNTGIFSPGADQVAISTNGTGRLFVDASGNVTINAQGDLRFADSDSSNWVALQAPATVASNVTWTLPSADGSSGQVLQTNGAGTLSWSTPAATVDKIEEGNTSAEVIDTGSDGRFVVTTEGSERLRVADKGALIGTTGFTPNGCRLEIKGSRTANGVYELALHEDGYGPLITFSRGASLVANNHGLGHIEFLGHDGVDLYNVAASIEAFVDGTPGANDMPGRLVFSTTADGASSPTERFRISNDGSMSAVIPGGSTLYPASMCRAWVNFDGTGTVAIRASYNVSSITDNGVGDYTVNFLNALPDANYSPQLSCAFGGYSHSHEVGTTRTTTTCSIVTTAHVSFTGDGRTLYDWPTLFFAVFR